MKPEDAEEYTQALSQVVAGSWRQIALAHRLGVPHALGLETRQWVQEKLGGYIKLGIPERMEAVRNLTDQGFSARQVAEIIGVTHETAASDVRKLTARDKRKEAYKAQIEVGCTVDDLRTLIAAQRRYGTIYADPPWLYENQATRGATTGHKPDAINHYRGMTVEEICALPIRQLAADDAHLHLWTTNGFLFECPKIFAAWGFEFRSSFVWVKRTIGTGNYWRNSHEFLLTAIRGDSKSFADNTLRSTIECRRGRHSAKPEQVRAMLMKASPGPFLELFGRAAVPNWTVWGDQIERTLLYRDIPEFAA